MSEFHDETTPQADKSTMNCLQSIDVKTKVHSN